MKLAFDTSVLVALVVEPHPHHQRALPYLHAVTGGEVAAMCSWHAAAETWSVLTRLPGALQVAPATADRILGRLLAHIEPVTVPGTVYRSSMQRCAERNLGSGAIFDALHLLSAEDRSADRFVTFNVADFARLASAASPPILVPPDPPSLAL